MSASSESATPACSTWSRKRREKQHLTTKEVEELFNSMMDGDKSDLELSDDSDSEVQDEVNTNMISERIQDIQLKNDAQDVEQSGSESEGIVGEVSEDSDDYENVEDEGVEDSDDYAPPTKKVPVGKNKKGNKKNVKQTSKGKASQPKVWDPKAQFEPPARDWVQCPTPQVPHNDEAERMPYPIEYFECYLPKEIIELMVNMTNLHAVQLNTPKFPHTTCNEINCFIGLHILMGTLGFPRIRVYWNKSLGIQSFTDKMTVNRFFKLRNHIHVVNNLEKEKSNTDRLWKVRPLYDAIRTRCLQLPVEKEVSIDEQMVPFKGRLDIKQYLPNKPSKWGIKVFILCGASGQMYDFIIYQGKTTELNQETLKEFGVGPSVILHLSKRIAGGSKYQLYYDNYFSSFPLLCTLKDNDVLAAGTVRLNRFLKPTLMNEKDFKKQDRGFTEEIVSANKKVVLVRWYDNKPIALASNFVGKGEIDQVQRWDKKNRKYITVARPEVIKLYNASMGGVDKLDFLISIYRTSIRSRKWTLKMFAHALDIAVTCSWLEYRRERTLALVPKKDIKDLMAFRLHVAETLLKASRPVHLKKRGRPSSASDFTVRKTKRENCERRPISEVQYDNMDHMPEHNGMKEAGRCKKPGCSGKSHFVCSKCKVHLCLSKTRNCYSEFHRL